MDSHPKVHRFDFREQVERLGYTPEELGTLLGRSRATIYRWLQLNEVPAFMVGWMLRLEPKRPGQIVALRGSDKVSLSPEITAFILTLLAGDVTNLSAEELQWLWSCRCSLRIELTPQTMSLLLQEWRRQRRPDLSEGSQ